MNDRFLFRAKRIENGEWVEGYYIYYPHGYYAEGEVDFLEGLWYIGGNVQNALYDINKIHQIKVIGSIFDNPELLEQEG